MRDSTWKPVPQSHVQITTLETLKPLPTPIHRTCLLLCPWGHLTAASPSSQTVIGEGGVSALTPRTLLLITTLTLEADTFLQWRPSMNPWGSKDTWMCSSRMVLRGSLAAGITQVNYHGYQRKQHFRILELLSKTGRLNRGRKFLPMSWACLVIVLKISLRWATPCFHVWPNSLYYFGKMNTHTSDFSSIWDYEDFLMQTTQPSES